MEAFKEILNLEESTSGDSGQPSQKRYAPQNPNLKFLNGQNGRVSKQTIMFSNDSVRLRLNGEVIIVILCSASVLNGGRSLLFK